MPETKEIDQLLKPAEVAALLNISRVYGYKLADRGILPCIRWKVDGEKSTVRFLKSDVLEFIKQHRQNGD